MSKKTEIENKQKIEGVINDSLSNLNNIVDSNCIIGTPIKTATGFEIIPISKITLGYLTGGGEYGSVKVMKEGKNVPYAGGSSAIVNVKPTAFLIDDGKECKVVRVTDEPFDNLIDKTSDLINKFFAND